MTAPNKATAAREVEDAIDRYGYHRKSIPVNVDPAGCTTHEICWVVHVRGPAYKIVAQFDEEYEAIEHAKRLNVEAAITAMQPLIAAAEQRGRLREREACAIIADTEPVPSEGDPAAFGLSAVSPIKAAIGGVIATKKCIADRIRARSAPQPDDAAAGELDFTLSCPNCHFSWHFLSTYCPSCMTPLPMEAT